MQISIARTHTHTEGNNFAKAIPVRQTLMLKINICGSERGQIDILIISMFM